jgi:hypothetical protein
MNRKMPRLQMNKLRILWFMVPMHSKDERGLSMNLRFVLVVLLVLVLDWWFGFEDEDEHEDEWGSWSQCIRKNESGLSMNLNVGQAFQPYLLPCSIRKRRSTALV